jgi:hypothetical protein
MITYVQAYLDACASSHPTAKAAAESFIDVIPAFQIRIRFADFAPRCPDRVSLPLAPRPANALNVEIGEPSPRCRQRTPVEWGEADPRAQRWLASGGSALVLGGCDCAACPRAKG